MSEVRNKKEITENILPSLPSLPGIYKYFDEEGIVLYVGKAKNIKKRVSSYFSKASHDNKTRSLISQIHNIEFVVVDSETDALLLENNLIKEHKPKYNILLRDDKTYPYIIVTKDRYPKVYSTRKVNREKGEYYGPYSSVGSMHTILDLIKKLFTIRNCDLNLTEVTINKQKFKKCLEYHIGNCKAPCENLQLFNDYIKQIEQVKLILNGDLSLVENYFKSEMNGFAKNMDFENAQKVKDHIDLLKKFQSNSVIASTSFKDQFVATYKLYNGKSFVNLIKVTYGRLVFTKTMEVINNLNETDEEVFTAALVQILVELKIENRIILTNLKTELPGLNIETFVPIKGEKRQLIDLSLKNIDHYISTKPDLPKENPRLRILEVMQKELNLSELPTHIECFDNSNLQGTTPVAAMVCFKNGLPFKSEWRHFNIKTVVGANDFESMAEIIYRRYARVLSEQKPLPNLIIVDGGKGQLSSAIKSLEKLGLYGKMPIISIAKRLEEIYTPMDNIPLLLKKSSETLKMIQRIRDEVHRFGITFHKKKRDTIKIK